MTGSLAAGTAKPRLLVGPPGPSMWVPIGFGAGWFLFFVTGAVVSGETTSPGERLIFLGCGLCGFFLLIPSVLSCVVRLTGEGVVSDREVRALWSDVQAVELDWVELEAEVPVGIYVRYRRLCPVVVTSSERVVLEELGRFRTARGIRRAGQTALVIASYAGVAAPALPSREELVLLDHERAARRRQGRSNQPH